MKDLTERLRCAALDLMRAEIDRLRAEADANLALWPRDCRLCAHFTTKTGGCTSLVQCVDSMQFRATAPRQYWLSGPNAELTGAPLGAPGARRPVARPVE